jgi:ADP-ribose pyrophosphatase
MVYKTLSSEPQYQGRAFSVRRDQVLTPNGRTSNLDIVEHIGAVTIVPIDSQGRIWFVRQYRHAAGVEILELPAGTLEKGEAAGECARREIREEIGMAAGDLTLIGEFFLAPGYSTEYMYVYLATDLTPSPLEGDDDEILQVDCMPLEDLMQMALAGDLRDAKTLAALLLVQTHIGSSQDTGRPYHQPY